jgi:hypothetical protein
MTSATAHPTWPLWQPSWIWFLSIIWQTPSSTGPIFLWVIGIISLNHIPVLPKPYLPYTHRQLPTRGHMPRLA